MKNFLIKLLKAILTVVAFGNVVLWIGAPAILLAFLVAAGIRSFAPGANVLMIVIPSFLVFFGAGMYWAFRGKRVSARRP